MYLSLTGGSQLLHELLELRLELVADGGEGELALLGLGALLVVLVRVEEGADEGLLALLDEALEGGVQRVVVLLDEVAGRVAHGARKVPHQESWKLQPVNVRFSSVVSLIRDQTVLHI